MTHRTNPNLQIDFLSINLQMLDFEVDANRWLLVDIEFVLHEFEHETEIEIKDIMRDLPDECSNDSHTSTSQLRSRCDYKISLLLPFLRAFHGQLTR